MDDSSPADSLRIRLMRQGECTRIADILRVYADQAILLWRTPEDILAHKDYFFVAVSRDEIVGCVALQDYGSGLFEIRSLAVKEAYVGTGIGSRLVLGIVEEARRRQAVEVFALTKKVGFFQHLGFRLESKDTFPQKVWKDCQLCRKRDCCDETAVAIRFDTVSA